MCVETRQRLTAGCMQVLSILTNMIIGRQIWDFAFNELHSKYETEASLILLIVCRLFAKD